MVYYLFVDVLLAVLDDQTLRVRSNLNTSHGVGLAVRCASSLNGLDASSITEADERQACAINF